MQKAILVNGKVVPRSEFGAGSAGRITVFSFIIILLGPPKVSKGRCRFWETGTAPLKPLEEHVGMLPKERDMLLRIL